MVKAARRKYTSKRMFAAPPLLFLSTGAPREGLQRL